MNKIKLFSIVALAGTLTLAGCGENEHVHTWEDKWSFNKTQHWVAASCHPEVCDHLGNHVDGNSDGYCDTCGYDMRVHQHTYSENWSYDSTSHWHAATCGHDVKSGEAAHVDLIGDDGLCDICGYRMSDPKPKVKSVSINGAVSKMQLNSTGSLSVSVSIIGTISNEVTWSVNNDVISLSSESGSSITITAAKVGTAVITATSVADATKFDSVTINVVDEGFDPSFVAQGYTFTRTFPTEQIKAFIGEGSYEVVTPSSFSADVGCYYKVVTNDGAEHIEIVLDGVVYEDYAEDLVDSDFTKVYQATSGMEAVDPTGIYTVAMSADLDEESYEDAAPTYLDFYKSSDVWADGTLTTDTAWGEDHIAEGSEDYVDLINDYLVKIPFVAMGAEYEINYVDNSFIRALIEAFGGDPSEYPDEFYICDYTISDSILAGYGEILKGDGFEELSDEYGTYYVKNFGLESMMIYTGFGEGGNTIYAELGVAILDAWPGSYVDEFVSATIGSKYSIPAYEESEGAAYMMSIVPASEEYDTYAKVDIGEVALTEVQAYFAALESTGYEVEYTPTSEKAYANWVATKGKIYIQGILVENYDEETETYDVNNGTLVLYIMGDDSRHEEPGVYLPESMLAILADGEFDLPLEVVELESPTFTVTSSNEEVATVDGLKVTPVAAGETTITVKVDGEEYEASITLTVSEKSLFELAVEDANEIFFNLGAEEELVLPDLECDDLEGGYIEDDGYYEIYALTSVTDEEYAEALKTAGWTITEDSYGYPIATKGDYRVEPWNYDEGELIIDIYYNSSVVGDGVIFDFEEITDPESYEINGFKYVTDKAKGQADPAWNEAKSELRLYANNTITFTSEEAMTSIFFSANTCGESKATASFVSASTGTVSAVSGGFLWEGNATEVTLTVSSSGQLHINYIEINGGGEGGGGGISGDVEQYLQDIEDITVDIAAKYLGKSASEITVDYDEGDADVYVWDYSDYGFVCTNFSVESSGNETTDLNKMKSALPSGAVLDEVNTFEEDDYHDIWYSYGDYSIGIYYYDGDASFAVVPTEMLDVYFSMMYGE